MKNLIPVVILLFLSATCFAGTVDTVSIYSNSMHKEIKAVVIKPDSYTTTGKKFPVVYLLHGYDGWYANWIIRAPELKNYADSNQLIIVCPDGAKSSWYFDSPVDPAYRYETHIVNEVVKFIDKNYRTIANKKYRAITGLSMGGHGALFMALRHQDIFGAAGSMSGGVDLKEVGYRFDLPLRIGDTISHKKEWHDLSITGLIEKNTRSKLKIIFDCGKQDIFINGNRRLHEKMVRLKIYHGYIEKYGQHNWDYWKGSIGYQLTFFRDFFNKK
jgi:S-formylglutathione hydrolase FrmB